MSIQNDSQRKKRRIDCINNINSISNNIIDNIIKDIKSKLDVISNNNEAKRYLFY